MRPCWIIKDCGVPFTAVTDWEKEIRGLSVELTEEEENSEDAKYFYRGIAMPTDENIKAGELFNEMPKELAFMPEEIIEKMNDEFIDRLRSGYCLMDNGIGFTVSRIQLHCTDAEFAFTTENFNPVGDLYYKCWYPGMHIKHYAMGAIEDVGLGMELIRFKEFIIGDMWKFGKDVEISDSLFISLAGLTGVSWPLHTPFEHERYVLQANWERDLPDGSGRERFVICWHGLKYEDGKIIRAIPENECARISDCRAQMNHAVWEFTQAEALVKMFCRENGFYEV